MGTIPLVKSAVSAFVYESFYPDGWRSRQSNDLGAILDGEPVHQGRGVGRALVQHAIEQARVHGMQMVMVEKGDDPGHSPARHLYEGSGFKRWPVARYFKEISGGTP